MGTSTTGRPGGLRRELRLPETLAVSVGVMAPTLAMSVTGAEAARHLGAAAPLAFAAAAAGVGLVASGFVLLAGRYPHAGSVYAFVGHPLGPRAGLSAAWALLGTYLVFPAVSMVGVAVFTGAALHRAGVAAATDWYPPAMLGLAAVAVTALRGIRPTARSVLLVEAVSVGLIGVVVVLADLHALAPGSAASQRFSTDLVHLPPGTGTTALVLAGTAGFLAFAGFESAGSLGEEALHPRTAVPRSIVLAVAGGGVLYVLCTVAQTVGFGTDAAGVAAFTGSPAPLDELATRFAGAPLAVALDVGAVLSAFGAGLGGVTVAARMQFALARDGHLPRRLARLDAAGVPRTALAVEVLVTAAALTGYRVAGAAALTTFFQLATVGVLDLLVMYVLTDLAAVRALVAGTRTGNAGAGGAVPRLLPALVPLAGAAVAGWVLGRNVWPVPPPPGRYLTALVAGWLVAGVVLAARIPRDARVLSPRASEQPVLAPAQDGLGP